MTKHVRIENADTSPYRVNVEVWDKGVNGEPHAKVETIVLPHPTSLMVYPITSSRYLVIKEQDAPSSPTEPSNLS